MGNIEISDNHLIFLATPYQTNSLKPISANGIHSPELSPQFNTWGYKNRRCSIVMLQC